MRSDTDAAGIFSSIYSSYDMMKRHLSISIVYLTTQVILTALVACADAQVSGTVDIAPPKSPASIEVSASTAQTPLAITLSDKGIFSDLDSKVALPLYRSKTTSETGFVVYLQKHTLTVTVRDVPTKTFPIGLGSSWTNKELGREETFVVSSIERAVSSDNHTLRIRLASRTGGEEDCVAPSASCIEMRGEDISQLGDAVRIGTVATVAFASPAHLLDSDGDGIPDQVDIAMGAVKADLNNAAYDDGYYLIPKKNGDVPRDRGCCSDVVIRALRNAGIDLQSALQADYQMAKRAYPFIRTPNASIDHRRIRNLVVYFSR